MEGNFGGEPIVVASALKHGVSESDALHVVHNAIVLWNLDEGVTMAKSSRQLIDDLDHLVKRFEEYEPRPEDQRDPQLYYNLEAAVRARAEAERAVVVAVAAMRSDGDSWATIGRLLGTSGQAAHQRYAKGRPH